MNNQQQLPPPHGQTPLSAEEYQKLQQKGNPAVDPQQAQRLQQQQQQQQIAGKQIPGNPQLPQQPRGQIPPHAPGAQLTQMPQQPGQRPQNAQQSSQSITKKIVQMAIQNIVNYKTEQEKQKKTVPDAKLKEMAKKILSNNDRCFRGSSSSKEIVSEHRRILAMPAQDLIQLISFSERYHADRKKDTDLNIQKNVDLLKFLQQYKSNNPQQNFVERENSSQQAVNNFNSKDDSFDAMVEEAKKEVKSQYNNQNNIYQNQMDYNEYNQNNEGQNNEMDRGSINNVMGYNEEYNEQEYI